MSLIIDALDFARHAGAHHGKIALSEFERLHDYLAANSGELQYAVTGALDKDARPVLQITVRGAITLRCQRCLGELEHKLDLSTVLRLAKNEHELARFDDDESVECILAARDTDVLMLIEDERDPPLREKLRETRAITRRVRLLSNRPPAEAFSLIQPLFL